MFYLGNAFSLQMIDTKEMHNITVKPLIKEEVNALLYDREFISCVGHADTAAVLDAMLEAHIECNRVNVKLTEDDVLIVAQVMGGRLPEGATTLPDNFTLQFIHISIN